MANPHRGEVTFEAGGKNQTLRLDTNAICDLEDQLDLSIVDIGRLLDAGRISIVRAAFRAGLVNGDGGMTLAEAGDIIDEIGYEQAATHLSKALERAFPTPQAGDDASPRKAGGGTGKRTS